MLRLVRRKSTIILSILWISYLLYHSFFNMLYLLKDNLLESISFFIVVILYMLVILYLLDNRYSKIIIVSSYMFSIWIMNWPIFGYNRFSHLFIFLVLQSILIGLGNFIYLKMKQDTEKPFINHIGISMLVALGHGIIFVLIKYISYIF